MWRLLGYLRPYVVFSVVSVVLMAVVGAMAALRLMLIKPIFDKVLQARLSPGRFIEGAGSATASHG